MVTDDACRDVEIAMSVSGTNQASRGGQVRQSLHSNKIPH